MPRDSTSTPSRDRRFTPSAARGRVSRGSSWCLTEKELIVALFPQNVKAYLAAGRISSRWPRPRRWRSCSGRSPGRWSSATWTRRSCSALIYPMVQMGVSSLRASCSGKGSTWTCRSCLRPRRSTNTFGRVGYSVRRTQGRDRDHHAAEPAGCRGGDCAADGDMDSPFESGKIPGDGGPFRPEPANRVSQRAPAAGRTGTSLEAEKLRSLKTVVKHQQQRLRNENREGQGVRPTLHFSLCTFHFALLAVTGQVSAIVALRGASILVTLCSLEGGTSYRRSQEVRVPLLCAALENSRQKAEPLLALANGFLPAGKRCSHVAAVVTAGVATIADTWPVTSESASGVITGG